MMTDVAIQYAVQLGGITTGAMALSEWATLKVGTPGKRDASGELVAGTGTRKRWSCLIYTTALTGLGAFTPLITLEGNWWEQAAQVPILAVVATGAAHLVREAKSAWDNRGK